MVCMCWGLNSHHCHNNRGIVITPIVGVYIPIIIRIPITRWDECILNIGSWSPLGTYTDYMRIWCYPITPLRMWPGVSPRVASAWKKAAIVPAAAPSDHRPVQPTQQQRWEYLAWRRSNCRMVLLVPGIWKNAERVEKNSWSRWWQLKYFLCSPLTLGKIPIWTNIFQRGWNHQLMIILGILMNEYHGPPRKPTWV